jgi:hypothetical protein
MRLNTFYPLQARENLPALHRDPAWRSEIRTQEGFGPAYRWSW